MQTEEDLQKSGGSNLCEHGRQAEETMLGSVEATVYVSMAEQKGLYKD
jgi:hypothetical protein